MIYILEDDKSIREMIVYTLNTQGYQASGYMYPSDFYAAIKEQKPQLIVLDIMLPEEDGIEVLKKLRKNPDTKATPIILLSAKDSEFDKVLGLDSGADDYLTKPFSVLELIARINVQLRNASDDQVINFDGIEIHTNNHQVYQDEEEVNLTLKEYELLLYLIKNKGQVISRDQILNQVWGYSFDGESRTVDVHVRSLRKKLGKELIETVHGVGYLLSENNE